MIPMRDLGDDYYDFDEKNYCLTGRRASQKNSVWEIRLPLKWPAPIWRKKQLDFALVEK